MKTTSELITQCISSLGLLGATAVSPQVVGQVCQEYARSNARVYHDTDHILHVASWIQDKTSLYPNPHVLTSTLMLATLYHDVVYQIGSLENEELSAERAARDLAAMGVRFQYIARIVSDIMDTRHQCEPETMEGRYMVDADLSSLALPIEGFWENTNQLWQESGKDAASFAKGNSAFLKSLLTRPRIFYSPCMDVEEKIARANISVITRRLDEGLLGQV